MSKNNKTKWWLGAILFGEFLLTFFMNLTGLALHQWLGIFIGILILYHLLTHLDWVNAVAGRLFDGTSNRSRLYLLIDILLACGFGMIISTGLLMSTWFKIPLVNYDFWRISHTLISILTLLFVALKLVLHWRWIAGTLRKSRTAHSNLPGYPPLTPVPANSSRMSRRQFLGVASVIGSGTLVAVNSAINSMNLIEDARASVSAQQIPTPSSTVQATPAAESTSIVVSEVPTSTQPVPTTFPATATVAPTSCIVRCNRHCSYPGQCRRYIDLNNNRLCDNGECL
jgi:hypothetical protein